QTVQVERLTGQADKRGEIGVNARWTRKKLTIYAAAAHARPLDSSQRTALIVTNGTLGFRQELFKVLALEAGVRLVRQGIQKADPGIRIHTYSDLMWNEFIAISTTLKPFRL